MHQIRPIPNLNGSKADDLAEQMWKVGRAIEEAAEVMRLWQPHGRDYQIGGDYKADHAEYMRRHRILMELVEQYQTEAMLVQERGS